MTVRIALAQYNMTVGDITGNRLLVERGLKEAREKGAQLVAFPELALSGYPPEDLLLKPDFLQGIRDQFDNLAPLTKGLTAIVGAPYADGDIYNSAVVFYDGTLIGMYSKHYLPNYGVFDENRYFKQGNTCPVFDFGNIRVGINICEDIWYPSGPPQAQVRQGRADLLINISASPYHVRKGCDRERMIATRAADTTAFVAYCNLVGGQDELIFDGHSLVCGPDGAVIARGPQFEEAFILADIDPSDVFRQRLLDPRIRKDDGSSSVFGVSIITVAESLGELDGNSPPASSSSPLLEEIEEVYQALLLGTRDYVRKNGFRRVLIGLSGGIDSSLTAAIAVEALGADNVIGIAMPTRYSSQHSLDDAELLANNLGIEYRVIPIDDTFQSFLDMLAPHFHGSEPNVAEENIQARVRGTLLMALSNKFGWLVLTTGNKSEVAVGYSTLYGDTAGGFAVIKDVPKTTVYRLCEHINQRSERNIIPENILVKPPSAELRPDQKDSDSLPDYAILDDILINYVERSKSIGDLIEMGHTREDVERVIGLIDRSEYKRRQSPPGIKIRSRAFGKDWRLPITNAYRAHRSEEQS